MQVLVEESGVIERTLTISVPAADVQANIESRLKNVAKNAKIPGFRPGKAPKSVIEQRYEPQVITEVVNETINRSYSDAIMKEEIIPAGLKKIEPQPYEKGADLTYKAIIEIYPTVHNPSLDGREVVKPVCDISSSDVERTLDDIRKRHADYAQKDGASAKDDRLTIDFTGTIGGEPFTGGSAEDFQFVLGGGQMLEAFDKGLYDVKVGDQTEIQFTFPEDYQGKEVAGKDAVFSVTVKNVESPVIPELDDAFAEKMGIKDGGIAKMREEVEGSLHRELNKRLRDMTRDRVMQALLDNNDLVVPESLTEQEIDRSVSGFKQQMSAQGIPEMEIDRERFREEAAKRVALGLIAREVMDKMEINLDEERVKSRLAEMASGYDDPEAFMKWYFDAPKTSEHRQQLESVVLEEQLVDALLDTATVKEERVDFQEFMQQA